MQRVLAIIGFLLAVSPAFSQECRKQSPSSEEILKRRQALLNLLDSTSALAIRAADADYDNDIDPYRQSPDFFYFTGIEDPGYKVIFTPAGYGSGRACKHVLVFAPEYLMKRPVLLSPTDTLLDDRQFDRCLSEAVKGIKTLYYSPQPGLTNDWIDGKVVIVEREARKTFEQSHPGVRLKNASRLFAMLRQVKTDDEIRLTREAIGMTREGILSALKSCRPGMYEYELQAVIEYEAMRRGARSMAYASIVGSGINSLSPHYDRNSCIMNRGSVVVMDVGARYQNYCADITRTIPVSGKFSACQARQYQAVLDIQQAVIDMVKPGITLSSLDDKTIELTRKAGYGAYILHGVTHPLGLVVHDVASGDTLRPGMIITVEPGIYIPVNDTARWLEGCRGTGIRIEDDILVTAGGHEVLSSGIPKEVKDIERIMKRKGSE